MIADEFVFERGPEALHLGVIIAVGSATHARDHAVAAQQRAVGVAGVLAAVVGVVEQPAGGLLITLCLRAGLPRQWRPLF